MNLQFQAHTREFSVADKSVASAPEMSNFHVYKSYFLVISVKENFSLGIYQLNATNVLNVTRAHASEACCNTHISRSDLADTRLILTKWIH